MPCLLTPGLRSPTGSAGPSAILAALIEVIATILAATSDSLAEYQVYGAVAIATLGWLWGVGDTYIAELFPTILRGTGFGIAVGAAALSRLQLLP